MRPIEFIVWKDAVSVDGWTEAASVTPTAHTIESVGFFHAEDDEAVTLALNLDTDGGNISCVMHIPKGMIVSRRRVTVPRKPRRARGG